MVMDNVDILWLWMMLRDIDDDDGWRWWWMIIVDDEGLWW